MKVGTIMFSLSAKESMRRAVLSESLGYDSFWLTDHLTDLSPGGCVDPWSTIGGISTQTNRILLGTSVTDAIRLHPAKLAQILLTLNEMTNGRVILGLGAGEAMNLLPYNLPFGSPEERAERLEESVRVMRLLWAATRNRPASFSGIYHALNKAWLDTQGRAPPVYLGVFGSRRTLEVVGKHADGWLPWINTPQTYAERVRRIKEAAKKAGRDPERLDYVAPMYTHMWQDRRSVRDMTILAKRTLLIEGYTVRKMGFSMPKELRETYQTAVVREEINEALDKLQELVPDELALEILTFGSPNEWIERMEKFREAGATHVMAQFLDQSEKSMRQFAGTILPKINRETSRSR